MKHTRNVYGRVYARGLLYDGKVIICHGRLAKGCKATIAYIDSNGRPRVKTGCLQSFEIW